MLRKAKGSRRDLLLCFSSDPIVMEPSGIIKSMKTGSHTKNTEAMTKRNNYEQNNKNSYRIEKYIKHIKHEDFLNKFSIKVSLF